MERTLLADGLPPYEFKRDFLDLDDLKRQSGTIFKQAKFAETHVPDEKNDVIINETINIKLSHYEQQSDNNG